MYKIVLLLTSSTEPSALFTSVALVYQDDFSG